MHRGSEEFVVNRIKVGGKMKKFVWKSFFVPRNGRYHNTARLRIGQHIQLFDNVYLTMQGIPWATGVVTQLRGKTDGFVFKCDQTGHDEVVQDGDGVIKILDNVKIAQ